VLDSRYKEQAEAMLAYFERVIDKVAQVDSDLQFGYMSSKRLVEILADDEPSVEELQLLLDELLSDSHDKLPSLHDLIAIVRTSLLEAKNL
jgi:hypothetical protein